MVRTVLFLLGEFEGSVLPVLNCTGAGIVGRVCRNCTVPVKGIGRYVVVGTWVR